MAKQDIKIKEKEVKINWDGKQMKVGIPAEFVEEMSINPEVDTINWTLIKNEMGYSLIGSLMRIQTNEKKDK